MLVSQILGMKGGTDVVTISPDAAISDAVMSGEMPRAVLEAAHRRVTRMKTQWLAG